MHDLLEKAKSLKDETDAVLNSVYVRKDQHPMVRKELARLYAVVKSEKEKPVNQGRTVEFNKDTRCVTVDGTVIDRFKIQFLAASIACDARQLNKPLFTDVVVRVVCVVCVVCLSVTPFSTLSN